MLRYYIPTFSKLRKSLKLRSKEYLRENTLHGFPYFIDSTRPIYERICWFICTLASLCAGIAIIVVIWNRFVISPTITGLDILTDSTNSNFPSIYLCMTNEQFDFSLIPENLREIYKGLYDWDLKPMNFTNLKLFEALSVTFFNITPQCRSLITNCKSSNSNENQDCDKMFKKVITPAGICCTSPSQIIAINNATYSQSFFYLHNTTLNLYTSRFDDDAPLRNEPTYLFNRNVFLDYHILITVAADGLRVLPDYQRSCIFPDEGSTYRKCVTKCMQKSIQKVCGCMPWYLKDIDDSKKNSEYNECELNEYNCLSKNRKALSNPKCQSNCYLSCGRTDYNLDGIKNLDNTEIIIRWPRIAYKREVRFGWLDLVVSFGGIMGLFLGYSLLTTVELTYYFSLRLYCGVVIDQEDNINQINNNKNILKINVAPTRTVKKKFDLKYFDYVD